MARPAAPSIRSLSKTANYMPARARRLAIFFGPAQVLQWNGTNWSALPQSLNPSGGAYIFALAFKNDTLFAGGSFTSAGAAVVDNIAAWDGQNWNAVNNALGGNDVFAVATQGTNVYLAGDFTSAAGTRVGAIVRWDGIHWWPLGGGSTNGVNQTVYALAASTFGPLYAAGNFSQAGGVAVVLQQAGSQQGGPLSTRRARQCAQRDP